jgi:pimeloyl-ACP methyl ester carboxylesterase
MKPQVERIDLFAETLRIACYQHGEGRPYLLLHGGAGSGSMLGLAGALGAGARVVTPIHPGFDAEPRPEWLFGVDRLATAYLALIERLGLRGVVLVGNSMGGWLAAEMALRKSPRIAGIVLLNAVGIDTGSPEKSIVDPMKIPREESLKLSFHDPKKFAFTPPSPEAAAIMLENQKTLRIYSSEALHDPTLHARLARLDVPSLVVWGESDRIVDVEYGRRFAAAIPGSVFQTVSSAGHLPQIEQPAEVVKLVTEFAHARG